MSGDDNILHKGLVPSPLALELVLKGAKPEKCEIIPLASAYGRVLAEDLSARRTQSPFNASAMDGYAARHEDLTKSGITLKNIGESAAGHPFSQSLGQGQTVRIFTGAPIPDGADTIVIQEDTSIDDTSVTILEIPPKGKYIRPAGMDFKTGEKLLEKNAVLNPQSLALCAAMDIAEVKVFQKPQVTIMATGDELVMPGDQVRDGQIIASNTFGIAAIAKSAGARVDNPGIIEDKFDTLKSVIQNAITNGSDLIVTSGGASVGDHDLVKPVLDSLGFTFSFVKIAARPGKPLIFATLNQDNKTIRFLGLPGNPVSSLVTSHIFLKPLIRLLAGYSANINKPVTAELGINLPANDERQEYMRATCVKTLEGKIVATPFAKQDSSMLANLARADCLLIRPVNAPVASKGDRVDIILMRDL